ncbi:hypothetical protein Leryth_021963 [Lithospermum erythrorhizon]|nr:hypothetical protein Leryth_021963 [Lithospermum erythrorhizon]
MSQLYAVIISLCFIITTTTTTFSEASRVLHDEKKHPYALVIGSVFCDTCSQHAISKNPNPTHYSISGALVAIDCADINEPGTQFTKQVKTNEHGEFQVHVPLSLNKIKKGCSVKLINSNDPNCDVSSNPTTTSLSKLFHLKSKNDQEKTIYSAGILSFKPSKHPQLCKKKQKPMIHNLKKMTLQVPNNDDKLSKTQFGIFPPIPFLPPPSILPPVIPSPPSSIFPPLTPAPPPSIFPPIFPSPPSPPTSIFPPVTFPPVPGFTPLSPPPPPPSPTLPVPLPPLPFPPLPPVPVFPGVPPAKISSVSP